jgi:hypothetical protein
MPSPYPATVLFGALLFVLRHQSHAKEHHAALLAALRAALDGVGMHLEADPESFRLNGEEVALQAPGVMFVNEQLLLHGVRQADVPFGTTDEDFIRLATVLASFAGTYDSFQQVIAALGPTAGRIALTPGANQFEVFGVVPWRPRTVFGPEAEEGGLDVPEIVRQDSSEFERQHDISIDLPGESDGSTVGMPTRGRSAAARPPLDVLLKQGRDAIEREDWDGLLEAALLIVEAEAEAPTELASSTHRIELKRLLSRKHLAMIARLAHGERKQEAIALLRRFGADATEILMDLLVEAMNMGERRGYHSAISQMNEGTDVIIQHLGHQHWYVVRNAAELCGEMELAGAVPLLTQQIDHPDERVRKAVAQALSRIGTVGTVDPLRHLFQDPSATVRIQAVAHLGGRRARGMTFPIGEMLRKEENPDVQHEALLALGRIGSPEAIALLKEYAAPGGKVLNRKPVPLRLTAVRALSTAGPPAADALAALQNDDSADVRAAATAALAALRP